MPLTSFTPSYPYLLINDTTHEPPIPLPIRVGDLSLDGFPDLLPIVASAPHGGVLGAGATSDRTPRLLTSIPCARGVPGCSAQGQGRRGFQAVSQGYEALQQVTDARAVTVLDLDEDVCLEIVPRFVFETLRLKTLQGTLDILVQRTGEQDQGSTLFVHNNFFYDAFFLKAMGEWSI
jgi:integrin alpha FG-GAP repeat containing protein 1